MNINLNLPPIIIDKGIGENKCYLFSATESKDFQVEELSVWNKKRFQLISDDFTILVQNWAKIIADFDYIISVTWELSIQNIMSNISNWKRIKHPSLSNSHFFTEAYQEEVLHNRTSSFNFNWWLRPPQVWAIYSTLSHWTVSNNPANIVMPTGTWKTECMLGIMVAGLCNKILVTVPWDALREQTFDKFLSLWILKKIGAIQDDALYPVVCKLEHRPKSIQEMEEICSYSQVIVTTMSIVTWLQTDIQNKLIDKINYFFIDEAHHIWADTWSELRQKFLKKSKKIMQFTATPFRNDKKNISWVAIYNYPLALAQQEWYFKNIELDTIYSYDIVEADKLIADRAVSRLKKDLEDGYEHVLMARVDKIERAESIYEFYKNYWEFNPVIIHSKIKGKNSILKKIKEWEHKIIICVGMLWEWFDLPSLKICALHDPHKSLWIILQFTWRFTRNSLSQNIWSAYFVLNIAEPKVEESLEELYSQDADWNKILNFKSAEETQKYVDFSELMKWFDDIPEISLQNIYPKLSTVVYQTDNSRLKLSQFKEFAEKKYDFVNINPQNDLIVLVKKNEDRIWRGNIKELVNINFDLIIIFFDKNNKLLYINSSNNGSLYKDLAKLLVNNPTIIDWIKTFRALHNISRVILHNVWLLHWDRWFLRFTMYTWPDVVQWTSDSHTTRKLVSNSFGVWYENWERVTIGVSHKWRIWSMKSWNILEFINRCKEYWSKLIDESIPTDKVSLFKNVLRPKDVLTIPEWRTPLWVERPNIVYEWEEWIQIFIWWIWCNVYDLDISLCFEDTQDIIKFGISNESKTEYIEFKLSDWKYSYISSNVIKVKFSWWEQSIQERFELHPPRIYFEDTSFIENNKYVQIPENSAELWYNIENINDTITRGNISDESQWFINKKLDSVQWTMFSYLKWLNYDILFNDDGKWEIADIIWIKQDTNTIKVDLFHCKYSHTEQPWKDIRNLYEVCWQATKSIKWKHNKYKIFDQLLRREKDREKNWTTSFEVGDFDALHNISKLKNKLDLIVNIHIVQPWLSKSKISDDQVKVLWATELYLKEVWNSPLYIFSSK
jgi:superfamily II DNA or RNA helicase